MSIEENQRKKIKLVKHKTAISCLSKYWDLSPAEYKKTTGGYVNLAGKKVGEFSVQHEIDAVKSMGFWGFSDVKKRIIHYWKDKTANPNDLMFFLGHEVAHIVGKREKNYLNEEIRANGYGEVAATAHKLFKDI